MSISFTGLGSGMDYSAWIDALVAIKQKSVTSVEDKIINTYSNIEVDYLKVGHHGSKSSTSNDFLEFVNAEEAIISVGKNSYGHPHEEVLNRLNSLNVNIKRTDINGTIEYRKIILWAQKILGN